MSAKVSALQAARASYSPKLPHVLLAVDQTIELGAPTAPPTHAEDIAKRFPETFGQPVATVRAGDLAGRQARPLKVGVVLSGGQAPGGHNVIAGLFDALKAVHPDSQLFGFLKGPGGVIKGKYTELTAESILPFRNTGGFSMIMSGRDKIEKPDDLEACRKNFEAMGLDGLAVVGGDDSNTNAAVLAEYLKAKGCKTVVVGVPKTIDGDMKNEQIETSFGFDTACKVYSELIGNIARDATSAVKYWHFIRLMGRAASHVTLECALQTQPNLALISEQVEADGKTLSDVVDMIVEAVVARANAGRHYGILLLPEGIIEFMPDLKKLIRELQDILHSNEKYVNGLPNHGERVQYVMGQLPADSAKVYGGLPEGVQAVLLTCDSHGNIPLSQVETERLLMDLAGDKIRLLEEQRGAKYKFAPLGHFLGYEGRCAAPTNFDADYCYSLGYTAALFVRDGLTGYTVHVRNLMAPAAEWQPGGTPVTMMLNMEQRKGKPTPVIKKTLVDLAGKPLAQYLANAAEWSINDCFVQPGPIQYFGPSEVCDQPTETLRLEST
ncbi:MAG: diphosphate--fructose-6-phosphate 1-phosphotransferase [Armatimonadetes bacterium]|nr:diphosphate--fructose-6-phosphate 1-phosphotransferase [Armatimonadota bacterium]